MSANVAIRAAAVAIAVVLLGAAAGLISFRPAVALAAAAVVIAASESWIALRATQRRGSARATPSAEAVVDTSALIDGRIREVVEAGFLGRALVVPKLVLDELQHIADSSDALRRARGRRGLEVLQALRGRHDLILHIVDDDPPDERTVDMKLVAIAASRGAALMTTDVALGKIARLKDVTALNLNDLAHAIRPVVLPGEQLTVTIVKEGKEPSQGVGYLDDGTMIVVEDGRAWTGKAVEVTVTGAIQTSTGKMIFAKVVEA